MEEKIKLFWLKKVHIVGSCLGKQRCIFPAERNHVGIVALEKNMLLILDIISITQEQKQSIQAIPISYHQAYTYDYRGRFIPDR
jgi:hypothetical protein